ncbi:unnamed protein product [Cyprideis torosa]|uniref:Uncharacterized protein n=1 Tax=Cyprideis torosa TaxID=163714 RepID=A0A7R8ZJ78_9CRUS|nr:unnamed protein product [Cyprideis torosa]CAG0879250.1 unnamed protein product [Cyprideis torosa]
MEVFVSKLLSLLLLGGVALLFGFLPLKVAKWLKLRKSDKGQQLEPSKAELTVSFLLCFGGGVLLATSVLHMLVDVRLGFYKAMKLADRPIPQYPVAESLLFCGFFMVYLVEELASFYASKQKRYTMKRKLQLTCATNPVPMIEGDVDLKQVSQEKNNSSTMQENGEATKETSLEVAKPAKQTFSEALGNLMIILALSMHGVFEGLAIGLQTTNGGVWILFFGVAAHKFVIAFCVGMELMHTGAPLRRFFGYMFSFCVTSPIGIAVGMAITAWTNPDEYSQELTLAVLQGLAGGTLLYVTFFEILDREKSRDAQGHGHSHGTGDTHDTPVRPNKPYGIYRLFFVVIGFSCMAVIEALVSH